MSGGTKVEQFNPANPISPIENSIASLFFEENYMKLYERRFVQLNYSEELFNGFNLYSNISYENRTALFNTTDQAFYPRADQEYLSNNPINPISTDAPFEDHNIVKFNLSAQINFGQKYLSYPDSKFNIRSEKYPTLVLSYEKGLGATNSDYNFDLIANHYHVFLLNHL